VAADKTMSLQPREKRYWGYCLSDAAGAGQQR